VVNTLLFLSCSVMANCIIVVFHLSSADCSACYSSSSIQAYPYLCIFSLCFHIYTIFIVVNIAYLCDVSLHICSSFMSHTKLIYSRHQTSWCPVSSPVHSHGVTQNVFNTIFLSLNYSLCYCALILPNTDHSHEVYYCKNLCKNITTFF
jgi:hypothetical protein